MLLSPGWVSPQELTLDLLEPAEVSVGKTQVQFTPPTAWESAEFFRLMLPFVSQILLTPLLAKVVFTASAVPSRYTPWGVFPLMVTLVKESVPRS